VGMAHFLIQRDLGGLGGDPAPGRVYINETQYFQGVERGHWRPLGLDLRLAVWYDARHTEENERHTGAACFTRE